MTAASAGGNGRSAAWKEPLFVGWAHAPASCSQRRSERVAVGLFDRGRLDVLVGRLCWRILLGSFVGVRRRFGVLGRLRALVRSVGGLLRLGRFGRGSFLRLVDLGRLDRILF